MAVPPAPAVGASNQGAMATVDVHPPGAAVAAAHAPADIANLKTGAACAGGSSTVARRSGLEPGVP